MSYSQSSQYSSYDELDQDELEERANDETRWEREQEEGDN